MRKIFLFAALLACTLSTLAEDFEKDGIYYDILGGDSVEVTYRGRWSSEYNEYSGSVTIPATVSCNSTTYRVISIGDIAFADCSSLTDITIPNSVTSIDYGAFYGCSSLTAITIPNSVTSIDHGAFGRCDNLETIMVEAGNSTYHSAGNCIIETATKTLHTGCKNSIIPTDGSVTSIGESAFHKCSTLTSIIIPDGIIAINCGDFTDGCGAFSYCSGLTSVTIPNSLISIGGLAFCGCSSLTDITIPNSVTSIGDNAFSDCSSLTDITIPNSVTSIGDHAFSGCSSLTDITIPNSVTSIGHGAFGRCDNLETIMVEAGNSTYHSAGNCIIETTTKTLHTGCKNSIIPTDGSVTTIGGRAFYHCSTLISITIPNGITAIDSDPEVSYVTGLAGYYGAFEGCSSLISITVPNSVTSIGNDAFYGCSSLTEPVYNAHVFAFLPTTYSGAYAIPSGIKSVAGGAFSYCSRLTAITIPNSVTSIGYGAFSYCSNLTEITCGAIIPPTIDDDTFDGIDHSIPLYVPQTTKDAYKAAEYWNEFTNIQDVLIVADGIYYHFLGGDSVKIVASPSKYAGSFTIPATIRYNSSTYRVTAIGEYAFADCLDLTAITIPQSVTTIGGAAFEGCTNIKKTNYTGTISSWCGIDFQDIISDIISNNTIYISNPIYYSRNFYINDVPIHNLVIPNDVKEIKKYAFLGDTLLTSVRMPQRLQNIGDYAFAYCHQLSDVTFPDKMDSIGYCAFLADTVLTTAVFPKDLKYIGYSAFAECHNLQSVTIPESVTIMDRNIFANCTNLKEVNYNAIACETINQYTEDGNSIYPIFYGCNSLTNITIGSEVQNIPEWLFAFVTSLTSIKSKAKTPPTVELYAFYNVPTDIRITVPCNTALLYERTGDWSGFSNINDGLVYDFNAISYDENTGLVQTIQKYDCDLPAIIKALPMEGYKFHVWSDGNTNDMRQITVDRDIDLAALFVPVDGSSNVDSVTIVPTDNTATFTWPAVEGATTYTLIVWADENQTERICTLTFDAIGRLINIDFSRNKPAKQQTSGHGLNFTVTGLEAGTQYYYTFEAKLDDVTLDTKQGTFTTEGGTGVDNIRTDRTDSVRKVFDNGTIYILKPNGEKYTVDGRRL